MRVKLTPITYSSIIRIFLCFSAKMGREGKADPCKPIAKVEWKSVRNRFVLHLIRPK